MSTHVETHMQHIKAGIKWQNMFGIDKNKPTHTCRHTLNHIITQRKQKTFDCTCRQRFDSTLHVTTWLDGSLSVCLVCEVHQAQLLLIFRSRQLWWLYIHNLSQHHSRHPQTQYLMTCTFHALTVQSARHVWGGMPMTTRRFWRKRWFHFDQSRRALAWSPVVCYGFYHGSNC